MYVHICKHLLPNIHGSWEMWYKEMLRESLNSCLDKADNVTDANHAKLAFSLTLGLPKLVYFYHA